MRRVAPPPSTRPCPSNKRRNSPSSENRKTSGPGGRPSGSPAPTSPTASRNTPNMRISAGASQVVSANRPLSARTRALSATGSSGRAKCGSPKLPTTASKAASSNGSGKLGIGVPELDIRMLRVCPGRRYASATSTPHTVAPRPAASAASVPGPGGHVEHPRARTQLEQHSGAAPTRAARNSTKRDPAYPSHPLFPGTRFKLIEGARGRCSLVADLYLLSSPERRGEPTLGQAVPR